MPLLDCASAAGHQRFGPPWHACGTAAGVSPHQHAVLRTSPPTQRSHSWGCKPAAVAFSRGVRDRCVLACRQCLPSGAHDMQHSRSSARAQQACHMSSRVTAAAPLQQGWPRAARCGLQVAMHAPVPVRAGAAAAASTPRCRPCWSTASRVWRRVTAWRCRCRGRRRCRCRGRRRCRCRCLHAAAACMPPGLSAHRGLAAARPGGCKAHASDTLCTHQHPPRSGIYLF